MFTSKNASRIFRCKTYQLDSSQTYTDGVHAITALSRDHPEIFFLSPQYTLEQCGHSLAITDLVAYSEEQITRIQRLLEKELSELVEGVSQFDDWEKERMIYERIASRYQYKKNDEYHDYNVVGLLLRKEGVCSAYANMLVLALRNAGIACHRVSGGGHAWTMVYVNDIPLHCDVTWESHQGEDTISYSYFNLSSEEIGKDHVLPDVVLPQSLFKGYGFHRKNHCFFTSAKSATKHIKASLWKGEKIIRVKTDCGESIESIVRRAISQIPFGQYQFSFNEKQGTAIILKA
jgi:hypothetical protein